MQADAEDNIAVKAPQGIEAFKQQQTMGNGVGWQYRPPFLALTFGIFPCRSGLRHKRPLVPIVLGMAHAYLCGVMAMRSDGS